MVCAREAAPTHSMTLISVIGDIGHPETSRRNTEHDGNETTRIKKTVLVVRLNRIPRRTANLSP